MDHIDAYYGVEISIPSGAIKSDEIVYSAPGVPIFQFLLVRLRDGNK
jgi:hypothetical protein